MATVLPGQGTLPKVADDLKVPLGGTVTARPGSRLHVVLAAETAPSLPLPPDIISEMNDGFGQLPVQTNVRLVEVMLVYVM
jgi:hypothetical protein